MYEILVDLRKLRKMESLSKQEEQAMRAVWLAGEGNLKLFLEQMDDPKPPYTTLASTIKNLEKKGYVDSLPVGKMYLYKALISVDEYMKKCMQGIVAEYFDNSYKQLILFFIKNKKLTAIELKEILDEELRVVS
ncbi:MAG TPA: BlaI/MecI/CopY family transcriptional regulator [Puia sp.]|nr:BlaI/MecI/CopY family transcriptional regulator [Puia sp.]